MEAPQIGYNPTHAESTQQRIRSFYIPKIHEDLLIYDKQVEIMRNIAQ